MKKPIIKKIKNFLKVSAIGVVISASIAGAIPLYSNLKYSSYNSDEQIVSNAEIFDADLGYMAKADDHFIRMEHNNGEPIYVCFDSQLTEQEKQAAIKTLEAQFDLMNKINNKYFYEIVDENEFNQKKMKTKIYYSLGALELEYAEDIVESAGHIVQSGSKLSYLTQKRTANDYQIYINREANKSQNQLEVTLKHELLHAFGIKDVYTNEYLQTTDKYYGNTFINGRVGNIIGVLTPNDVACLISVYAEKTTSVKELKKIQHDYEQKYYDIFTKRCLDKGYQSLELEDDDFVFEGKISVTEVDGTMLQYYYDVQVEDGRYEFLMFDAEKNLIDESYGVALIKNGVVILTGVDLKKGIRPNQEGYRYEGGYVQDIIIADNGHSVVLYDLIQDDEVWGEIYNLEKNIMQ